MSLWESKIYDLPDDKRSIVYIFEFASLSQLNYTLLIYEGVW
jgi:hypothetical protein